MPVSNAPSLITAANSFAASHHETRWDNFRDSLSAVVDRPVELIDLLPTLCELAGAPWEANPRRPEIVHGFRSPAANGSG